MEARDSQKSKRQWFVQFTETLITKLSPANTMVSQSLTAQWLCGEGFKPILYALDTVQVE